MNFRGLAILLLVSLLSCDEEEAVYPELQTNGAQQIGSTSVVLEATIMETGSVRPIRYGFLWDDVPDLNIAESHTIDLGTTDTKRDFSVLLENLDPNTTYHAKAYAANMDYTSIYYGNEIEFTTLP